MIRTDLTGRANLVTYPLPKLIHRWDRGEFTTERTAGHLLQHLEAIYERLAALEKRVRQVEQPSAPRGR